ncbi:MAG: acetate/propionate family kinase, partial [Isosphaeraceae bacterium]
CRGLDWFGIALDPERNASGDPERKVSTDGSRVEVWTLPTNEELVVARQSRDLLASGRSAID